MTDTIREATQAPPAPALVGETGAMDTVYELHDAPKGGRCLQFAHPYPKHYQYLNETAARRGAESLASKNKCAVFVVPVLVPARPRQVDRGPQQVYVRPVSGMQTEA